MDALGVQYEYEKEAYHFGPGGQYLPDFWLPEQRCWVEIKGTSPTFQERRLCAALHVRSGHEVFLFQGDFGVPVVEPTTGTLFGARAHAWAGCQNRNFSLRTEEAVGQFERFGACWKQCSICLKDGRDVFFLSEWARRLHARTCFGAEVGAPDGAGLVAAYSAARSARFEHGETPKHTLRVGVRA